MNRKIYFSIKFIVALILIQTLYFKFSGHPDSVHIFSSLKLEPFGRIIVGVSELIAAILLFIPKMNWLGAFLSLGIISVAIVAHLAVLGIEINGDGGTLFILALIVFILSIIVLLKNRENIPFINKKM